MTEDRLTIEDDDGFRTEWPWPKGRMILANGDFVELCVKRHDAMRANAAREDR